MPRCGDCTKQALREASRYLGWSEEYFQLWHMSKAVKPWDLIGHALQEHVMVRDVFFTEMGKNGQWLLPSQALVEDAAGSLSEELIAVLLKAEFPFVRLDSRVRSIFQDGALAVVTPTRVRGMLHEEPHSQYTLSIPEAVGVLRYCLSDTDEPELEPESETLGASALVGLCLLPVRRCTGIPDTQDEEEIVAFQGPCTRDEDKFWCCTDSEFKLLNAPEFGPSALRFVHSRVVADPDIVRLLTRGRSLNVHAMDARKLLEFVAEMLGSSSRRCTWRDNRDPDQDPSMAWLKELWGWVAEEVHHHGGGKRLSLIEELNIACLPVLKEPFHEARVVLGACSAGSVFGWVPKRSQSWAHANRIYSSRFRKQSVFAGLRLYFDAQVLGEDWAGADVSTREWLWALGCSRVDIGVLGPAAQLLRPYSLPNEPDEVLSRIFDTLHEWPMMLANLRPEVTESLRQYLEAHCDKIKDEHIHQLACLRLFSVHGTTRVEYYCLSSKQVRFDDDSRASSPPTLVPTSITGKLLTLARLDCTFLCATEEPERHLAERLGASTPSVAQFFIEQLFPLYADMPEGDLRYLVREAATFAHSCSDQNDEEVSFCAKLRCLPCIPRESDHKLLPMTEVYDSKSRQASAIRVQGFMLGRFVASSFAPEGGEEVQVLRMLREKPAFAEIFRASVRHVDLPEVIDLAGTVMQEASMGGDMAGVDACVEIARDAMFELLDHEEDVPFEHEEDIPLLVQRGDTPLVRRCGEEGPIYLNDYKGLFNNPKCLRLHDELNSRYKPTQFKTLLAKYDKQELLLLSAHPKLLCDGIQDVFGVTVSSRCCTHECALCLVACLPTYLPCLPALPACPPPPPSLSTYFSLYRTCVRHMCATPHRPLCSTPLIGGRGAHAQQHSEKVSCILDFQRNATKRR